MKTKIKFKTIEDVKNFNNDVMKFESDIDIMLGKYLIDGKSLMALFTLDLSKVLDCEFHARTKDEETKFIEVIKGYMV